jgi:hypothetical protein
MRFTSGPPEGVKSARLVVEVSAGLIPERPEPTYGRRLVLPSQEWNDSKDQAALLAELNGRAMGYAGLLMLQPDRLNWVRTDWLWL